MIGPQRLEAALLREVFNGRVRIETRTSRHILAMGPVLGRRDFWSHRVYYGPLRPSVGDVDGVVFAKAVNPRKKAERRKSALEERTMLWLAEQWQERLQHEQGGSGSGEAWTWLVAALPHGHYPFQQVVRRVTLHKTYAPAEALLTRGAGTTPFAPKGDAQLLDYSLQLCAATALMHEAGVGHCDIKPDNVAVVVDDSAGRVRVTLIDFELAVHRGAGESDMSGQGTVGTVGFTAPEVEASGGTKSQCGSKYEVRPADAFGVGKTIDAALHASTGVSEEVRASVREVVEQLTVDAPGQRVDVAGACVQVAQIADAHGFEFAPRWVEDENRHCQM